ncbi:MAG: sugar porter family MFS transporter [Bacteroidales bacterium]|nr:sugar porter family MFS transporter [Bacteroidales bacterium]
MKKQIKEYRFSQLLFLTVVTALGGLLFGYDISVISGTVPYLQDYYDLTEASKGFAVSSAYIGCIIGVLFAGKLSDNYGRKIILVVAGLLFIVSAIGSGWSQTLTGFIIYRVLGGVAVGTASILAPMYISEISPRQIRGKMVSINQLNIVIGIAVAYLINYFLVDLPDNWRWMFTAEAVPAFIFSFSMLFVPESPRWLVKKGKHSAAESVLSRIGTESYVQREIAEIRESLNHIRTKAEDTVKSLFKPGLRKLLVIGIVLAVLQQWSGINVVFFYAPDIFKSIEVPMDAALFQTTIIGLVNVVFTLVAMRLVDKVGRKVLLKYGALGMGLCYVFIGAFFYQGMKDPVFLLIFFLLTAAFYSMSLAPLVWVVISEIFPNRIRGLAMSAATVFLWIACYVLTLTFPILMEAITGSFTFWIYAVICFAGVIFVWKVVPETKGKSLEQLEKELIPSK